MISLNNRTIVRITFRSLLLFFAVVMVIGCSKKEQPELVKLASISVSKQSLILGVEESYVLEVQHFPSSFKRPSYLWSSSDVGIVEVDGSGVVTAKSVGTAIIKVTNEEKTHTSECEITVMARTISKVIMSRTQYSVYLGEEYQLSYLTLPSDAAHSEALWSSSNEGVATVSSTGLVKAINPGTATISVTLGALDASCEISVEKISIRSILFKVNGDTIRSEYERVNLKVNSATQIEPIFDPSVPLGSVPLVWSSSNSQVSVTPTGIVSSSDPYATSLITLALREDPNISRRISVIFFPEYPTFFPATSFRGKDLTPSPDYTPEGDYSACRWEVEGGQSIVSIIGSGWGIAGGSFRGMQKGSASLLFKDSRSGMIITTVPCTIQDLTDVIDAYAESSDMTVDAGGTTMSGTLRASLGHKETLDPIELTSIDIKDGAGNPIFNYDFPANTTFNTDYDYPIALTNVPRELLVTWKVKYTYDHEASQVTHTFNSSYSK